jgi:uncharacterized membrane protein
VNAVAKAGEYKTPITRHPAQHGFAMTLRRAALSFVFLYFFIGGIGHFAAPAFFLKIVPPQMSYPTELVYISGGFELLGALGLLHQKFRWAAGIGLMALTIAVTPANIYMWRHPELFPTIPEILLTLRLVLQVGLLWLIWWATRRAKLSAALGAQHI